MTLLMFDQREDKVLIFTDTLVVNNDDEPKLFRSKVWTLPHLNMAMVVTGTAQVGDLWFQRMGQVLGKRDIIELDEVAPGELRGIHAWLTREHGDIGTSTVYVFGFPQGAEKVMRYTYRSINGYVSEHNPDDHGFAIKPPSEKHVLHEPESIAEAVAMAYILRDEHAKGGTSGEVLPIGGDLFMTVLMNGYSSTERVHRFSDYAETWAKMKNSCSASETAIETKVPSE